VVLNDNLKGALLMALAMAGFNINDALTRYLTADLTPGQIMFIRGGMTSMLIFVVAWRWGAFRSASKIFDRWVAFRTVGEIIGAVTYVYALSQLPLPNASAILQALPLAVTMGAAVFLREKVGWRRWAAILVGFSGVLLIIRPGAEGFTTASLFVVGSVIGAASRDVVTKKIDPKTPALMISLIAAVAITIVGAIWVGIDGEWKPVSTNNFLLLILCSVLLFAGYQAIVLAMRKGEISFIAPFRYTSLIWAIALAILLLGEIPDMWMLIGSAIVVAAGLYSFYRETVTQRRRMAEIESNLTVS
jgi:drug/metabolite transporter (DMT)-like permease